MDVPLFVALTCDDWMKNDATVSLVTSRTVVVVDGDIVGVRKGTSRNCLRMLPTHCLQIVNSMMLTEPRSQIAKSYWVKFLSIEHRLKPQMMMAMTKMAMFHFLYIYKKER